MFCGVYEVFEKPCGKERENVYVSRITDGRISLISKDI